MVRYLLCSWLRRSQGFPWNYIQLLFLVPILLKKPHIFVTRHKNQASLELEAPSLLVSFHSNEVLCKILVEESSMVLPRYKLCLPLYSLAKQELSIDTIVLHYRMQHISCWIWALIVHTSYWRISQISIVVALNGLSLSSHPKEHCEKPKEHCKRGKKIWGQILVELLSLKHDLITAFMTS